MLFNKYDFIFNFFIKKLNKKLKLERQLKNMTKNEITMVIFDLDFTMIKYIGNDIYIYNYVIPTLEYLKSKNIKIGLASYNPNAVSILAKLDILHFFDFIQCEQWELRYDFKQYMLNQLLKDSKITSNNILYIDDSIKMINTGKKMGMHTHLIVNGDVNECLNMYFNLNINELL
jgi:HAD superfamily hydrolase (TIGR01509 family)